MEYVITPPRVNSVIHVVPALFGEGGIFGGAERYVLELARHMAEVIPTTLLTFGKEDTEFTDRRLRVRVLSTQFNIRGQFGNPMSLAMLKALRGYDIIHCHQQHILSSSVAAMFCRLTGRKVVVSDLGGGGWDVSSYISTDRWYHAHLHLSDYSRKVSGHIDKPWAHVIYGGVDTGKFSPDDKIAIPPTIAYIGRILPHKGINYLIEALPDGVRLEVIGRAYDPTYFTYLRTLATGKRVEFRTDAADADIVAAYRRALCVVLPSVYIDCYGGHSVVPELLGQTLLEGMACARPVICTEVASMPEIVSDGKNGFVAPPNNSSALRERIEWLRDHPAEAYAMGYEARATVLRRFTWPVVVARCLEIYSSPEATL